jgi:hypothetical protein
MFSQLHDLEQRWFSKTMSIYRRKGGHGGPRPNSGRPKGARDKVKRRTVTRDQIERLQAEGRELPLARLLRRMADESEPQRYRDSLAIAAAPYVHARLSSIATAKTAYEMSSDELVATIARQQTQEAERAGGPRPWPKLVSSKK